MSVLASALQIAADLGFVFWGVPASCLALVLLYLWWMRRVEQREQRRARDQRTSRSRLSSDAEP